MRPALRSLALAATAALALPAVGSAQTVVTTYAPAGAATAADGYPGTNVWYRDDVRVGSSAGITGDYARSGNGSVLLTGNQSGSKANLAYFMPAVSHPFLSLANIGGLAYDWYRDGSSTVAAHLAPALRMLVDADGDLGTAGDRGTLIFEPVYNGYPTSGPGVPEDQWMTSSIVGTTNLWFFQSGVGVETVYDRTLADYQAGTYTPSAGFAQLRGTSLVYGLSFGSGSGWAGDFRGAVDNVTVQLTTSPVGPTSIQFNFEQSSTVPEPSTYALMGTGLLGVLGAAWRRRRSRDA